jgi:hypothetical protein
MIMTDPVADRIEPLTVEVLTRSSRGKRDAIPPTVGGDCAQLAADPRPPACRNTVKLIGIH